MDEFQAEMLRRLKYMFDLPEGSTPQDILGHLQKVLDYLGGGGRAAGAAPLSLMAVLELRDQTIADLSAKLAAAPAAAPDLGALPHHPFSEPVAALYAEFEREIIAAASKEALDARARKFRNKLPGTR